MLHHSTQARKATTQVRYTRYDPDARARRQSDQQSAASLPRYENASSSTPGHSLRLEIDNNAAERLLRTVVLGRKNYLFAGSDRGGERAAAIYGLSVPPN